MDATVFDAWVARLEANTDQQTDGKLRNPMTGAMCCLGVLADEAYGSEVWIDESGFATLGDSHLCATTPPLETKGRSPKLDSTADPKWDPIRLSSTHISVLTQMNDGGKTFPEIAAWLREHRDELVDG